MTREERLKFCEQCTKRKFDMKMGLVCSLTGEQATFEGTCPDYDEDAEAKFNVENRSRSLQYGTGSIRVSSIDLDRMKSEQSINYAITGGFLAAIVSALLWAMVTLATNIQLGFMAVGVGFLVGAGVGFFGQGLDRVYGIIGALFALFGCLLGNFLSLIGYIAQEVQMDYFEVFSLYDYNYLFEDMVDFFHPMDALFYMIALYEGFKFSFKDLSGYVQKNEYKALHPLVRPLGLAALAIIILAAVVKIVG